MTGITSSWSYWPWVWLFSLAFHEFRERELAPFSSHPFPQWVVKHQQAFCVLSILAVWNWVEACFMTHLLRKLAKLVSLISETISLVILFPQARLKFVVMSNAYGTASHCLVFTVLWFPRYREMLGCCCLCLSWWPRHKENKLSLRLVQSGSASRSATVGTGDLSGKECSVLLRAFSPRGPPDHHSLTGRGAEDFAISYLKLLPSKHKTFAAELNEILLHLLFASSNHWATVILVLLWELSARLVALIFVYDFQNDWLELPDRGGARSHHEGSATGRCPEEGWRGESQVRGQEVLRHGGRRHSL